MARPTIDPDDLRTKSIRIRVSADEHEILIKAARMIGVTLSDYLRHAGLVYRADKPKAASLLSPEQRAEGEARAAGFGMPFPDFARMAIKEYVPPTQPPS